MRGGSGALGCILLCIGVLALSACADSDEDASGTTTTSSTTTTTVPPGPTLDTTTDDVEAAMRSLLEFEFWSQIQPTEGLARVDEWIVPSSPYAERVVAELENAIARGLTATDQPDVLDVVAETQGDALARVRVEMRSDAYLIEAFSDESFETQGFDATLFIYYLEFDPGTGWRIWDRNIPQRV